MKLHCDHFIDRLTRGGVLLTTKSDEKVNTMTIGWGSISQYWGKDVMIVPVRHSRFTHDLIEGSDNFTVSVPKYKEISKEIAYCGTHSGRDGDKFKDCGLTTTKAKSVDTPIVKQGYLHYECKIVAKVEMTEDAMDQFIVDNWYGGKDFHTLYFGEIVECYITD